MHVPVTLIQLVPGLVLGHESELGHELGLGLELDPGLGPEVAGHIQQHSKFKRFRNNHIVPSYIPS